VAGKGAKGTRVQPGKAQGAKGKNTVKPGGKGRSGGKKGR